MPQPKQDKGPKMVRARKNSDGDGSSENTETVGTFETLRDEGEHFMHVKQWQRAIDSFTKALEREEDDIHCLVARSRCYIQLGDSENALKDADNCLSQDPQFIKALYMKAESMYQKGDFETALVYFHRGNKLRSELQEFRLGIQKCQEAINNSIGSPDSVQLKAKGDLSYFYKQEEAEKNKKGKKGLKGYNKPQQRREDKKERQVPKNTADAKTTKELLGELYGDQKYLERLLGDESLVGNKTDTSKEIKDQVCDGLEYLYSRADFWRQQKPMYARKRDRQRREQRTKSGKSSDPSQKILKSLEEIDEAQANREYEESLHKSKKTMKYVDNCSDSEVPNKVEVQANLHSCMGNAYLEMEEYNQALHHHQKDLDIAKDYELEEAKSRALDNLGRVYARMGEYDKAIALWEEKLPLSKSALESTWLYHEIGRCYLEMGKYRDSRNYGEQSLKAAKEADDESWQLHGQVLVAQCEVKLGELQPAADSFERSLELARSQGDTAAEDALQKALDEVNERIVEQEKKDDRRSASPNSGRKEDSNLKEDVKQEPAQSPKHEQQPVTQQEKETPDEDSNTKGQDNSPQNSPKGKAKGHDKDYD